MALQVDVVMNCRESTAEQLNIEVDLVLEALYRMYGYDFRSYSRASVVRRLSQFAENGGYESISAIIPHLLKDNAVMTELVQYLSIPVTEMFRDPSVYQSIRKKVFPILKTYPFVKIWVAGCATGEEVYSIAILAHEQGMADKTTIYGTDFNDTSLEKAKRGIYRIDRIKSFTRNYLEAGGTGEFSDYYHADYQGAIFNESLKRRIVLANHNLASDSMFGEMHLIMCRNVLIYFNKELQNRVLQLFTNSLVRGGFLCLGTKESLSFSTEDGHYSVIDNRSRVFKKEIV